MSRRDQIRMTDEELLAFLAEQRVVTCATIGPNGRPHLMPLWYVPEGTDVLCWTYARSQKARNLRRDPKATLQVETGETYDQLRGAMLECDVELITDPAEIEPLGLALTRRYAPTSVSGNGDPPPELKAFVAQQATKRVGMRFRPTRVVTWDHRKLGGTY
jgi:PPOX class probable F420-dependent enzyme